MLKQAIIDCIDYYNNKRIKVKLKGLSPIQYRAKSFASKKYLTFLGTVHYLSAFERSFFIIQMQQLTRLVGQY